MAERMAVVLANPTLNVIQTVPKYVHKAISMAVPATLLPRPKIAATHGLSQ
jgi:hypothetical protein